MASPPFQNAQNSHKSVQELARDLMLVDVPPQYLQENQEPTLTFSHPTSIPVVDMNSLLQGESKDLELQNFDSICQEWGVFQLVNHGVSSMVMEKLKNEIEEFYKLSQEEKMKYNQKPGEVQGYGQTVLHSEDQKIDWADRFYIITNPIHLRKPHLLPQLPSSLRDALEVYIKELQKLAMMLFGIMGEALKMEKREMEEMFENGIQSIRMTYYPPCPKPEQVIGLTPHSDATGITILQQINGVEGFQVKKDGVWIPVNFLPNSLVVNVGDILEILSNGAYNSIEHRATVNRTKERISLAMFFNPKLEAEVGPSTSLTNKNPPLFKRFSMEKYVKDFFSRKLNGKLFLNLMRINNKQEEEVPANLSIL